MIEKISIQLPDGWELTGESAFCCPDHRHNNPLSTAYTALSDIPDHTPHIVMPVRWTDDAHSKLIGD